MEANYDVNNYTITNVLAKQGLVIVQAEDVKCMMDYFRMAKDFNKTSQTRDAHARLWDVLHEVGLEP